MKAKWIAGLVAMSLVTAPAVAQIARPVAPASNANQTVGGAELPAWIILIGIILGATYAVVQEENQDPPASP